MKQHKKTKTRIDENTLIAGQIERFAPLLSSSEHQALLEIIHKPLLPAIRFNPLKSDDSIISVLSNNYGWTFLPVPYCSRGFRVQTNSGPLPSETVEYKNGYYYIQEASSMLPVELFSFSETPNALTLDLAASPGGKTTHLVSRMEDTGLILANDSSQGRLQALKIVLQQWGATNTAVTRFPGESFGSWFPETFDRVLIDAPCSMQGLRTSESHPPRPVTEKETKNLARRQSDLLSSAIRATRIGGEIVYSTCTLAPEENEEVVESILSRFKDLVDLEDAQRILPIPAPGISSTNEIELRRTIRFWPHRYDTAGFFACILKKTGSTGLNSKDPPSHSMEKAGFIEVTPTEADQFCQKFESVYGYPMRMYIRDNDRILIHRDDKFFIFPRLLLDRFPTLPVQYAGLQVCTITGDGVSPTFEWASRFGTKCKHSQISLSGMELVEWQKGNDIPFRSHRINSNTDIYIVLDEKDRFRGRGKLNQGNLKNLDYRRYL